MIRKSFSSVKGRVIGAVVAVAAVATPALAQSTPPDMDPIEFPVSISSVATAVAVAFGTIIIAWAGLKIGFGLTKKAVSRFGSAC